MTLRVKVERWLQGPSDLISYNSPLTPPLQPRGLAVSQTHQILLPLHLLFLLSGILLSQTSMHSGTLSCPLCIIEVSSLIRCSLVILLKSSHILHPNYQSPFFALFSSIVRIIIEHVMLFTIYLFIVHITTMRCKCHGGRQVYHFCFLLFSQVPKQCLVSIRRLIDRRTNIMIKCPSIVTGFVIHQYKPCHFARCSL